MSSSSTTALVASGVQRSYLQRIRPLFRNANNRDPFQELAFLLENYILAPQRFGCSVIPGSVRLERCAYSEKGPDCTDLLRWVILPQIAQEEFVRKSVSADFEAFGRQGPQLSVTKRGACPVGSGWNVESAADLPGSEHLGKSKIGAVAVIPARRYNSWFFHCFARGVP
jgi:hypothetical protein